MIKENSIKLFDDDAKESPIDEVEQSTDGETGTDPALLNKELSQLPLANAMNSTLPNITAMDILNDTNPNSTNQSTNATAINEQIMREKRHNRTLLIFLLFAAVMIPFIIAVLCNCCGQKVDENEDVDKALSPRYPVADVKSPAVAVADEPSLSPKSDVVPV